MQDFYGVFLHFYVGTFTAVKDLSTSSLAADFGDRSICSFFVGCLNCCLRLSEQQQQKKKKKKKKKKRLSEQADSDQRAELNSHSDVIRKQTHSWQMKAERSWDALPLRRESDHQIKFFFCGEILKTKEQLKKSELSEKIKQNSP